MPGTVEFQVFNEELEEVIEGMEYGGLVTYTTDYAHHIEFDSFWGASPPPFTPLRKWVDRKWPDLDGGLKDAGLGSGVTPNSSAHKDGVAWVVIKSIQETGIAGIFYGHRALEFGKQKAESVAKKYEGSNDPRASEKIVEDILDLMFEASQKIIREEATDTGNLLESGMVDVTEDIGELPEVA